MRTPAKMALVALLLIGVPGCAYREPVTSRDFGGGHSIRIWWQHRAIWDWNDPSGLELFYDVTRNGQTVVPRTWLTLDLDEKQEFDIATAVADGGNLVCVYDRNAFRRLFILFDKRSGESWPRLREDEARGDAAAEAKWAKRYRQLLAENPGFPRNRLRELAPEPIDPRDVS